MGADFKVGHLILGQGTDYAYILWQVPRQPQHRVSLLAILHLELAQPVYDYNDDAPALSVSSIQKSRQVPTTLVCRLSQRHVAQVKM